VDNFLKLYPDSSRCARHARHVQRVRPTLRGMPTKLGESWWDAEDDLGLAIMV